MSGPTLYQRLDNPQVLRVYIDMIRKQEESIVRELRVNLTEKANTHRHFPTLEEEFVKRLGE